MIYKSHIQKKSLNVYNNMISRPEEPTYPSVRNASNNIMIKKLDYQKKMHKKVMHQSFSL